MQNLPPLIDESKFCYCEAAGGLIYAEEGEDLHPSIAALPIPDIKELQRRAKLSGKTNQFLESPDDIDTLSQFKLTIESDGIFPAVKGLALYNPYSLSVKAHWTAFSDILHKNLPTQINSILSKFYEKEIEHTEADGLISCFDWHSRVNKLAVSLKDDSVKVFYEKNNLIPLIKHKRQVGINVIRWKPLVDDILGVGCIDCCILWTIDPNSLSARPGSGCAQVISSPSDQPIHSLSWDPNSCLLALSSKKCSKLEIWDSDREELTFRKSGLTPISKVLFNSNGERLLVCGHSTLTVYQCCNWTAETWNNLECTVHHAAWSSCGNNLIFATTNKIFCIGFNTVIGGESDAKLLYELPYNISDLVWSNDRLAVSLEEPSINAVLLLNTQMVPSGAIRADINGWIPGPEKATLMSFKPFKYGALLSIVYPSGAIHNVPLLYLHLDGASRYDAKAVVNDTLASLELSMNAYPSRASSLIQTSFMNPGS